jgi:predicted Na+-dependent transporter
MNLKRILSALLTDLGIAALIYVAVLITNTSGSIQDIKSLVIYGILGLIFFSSGISLVRTTKDES